MNMQYWVIEFRTALLYFMYARKSSVIKGIYDTSIVSQMKQIRTVK